MSSRKRSSSSSEDDDQRYALVDEKKRKRMISNRESARRSRMRREQHIKDLNDEILYLTNKNKELTQQINEITPHYTDTEAENRVLRWQSEELRRRLESMEMVSSYMCEANNESTMDILQDPLLRPWEPPVQSQPIMTSAGTLPF